MQSCHLEKWHLPYHPTVLFCHTSNTRRTSSCQKTLSACFLNKRTGCGRYCFRALYFHVRRACKVAGTQDRGYVLQKCPETSNVTLSAERQALASVADSLVQAESSCTQSRQNPAKDWQSPWGTTNQCWLTLDIVPSLWKRST